jgi:filamentous hemagglutinin family protein
MTSFPFRVFGLLFLLAVFAMMFQPTSAPAGPEGGKVVAGQASIHKSRSDTNISQSSNRAVINWNSFDIGRGETVDHRMPGPNSAGLHRVIGGGGASQLEGALKSNGNVYLVNPKGVVIHDGAKIDTRGFVATTSDIKNEDFMTGNLDFGIKGSPGSAIVNRGEISVREHGYAALVAPHVRNEGIIAGKLSTVALASTDRFKLDVYGDDLINFAVDDDAAAEFYDTNGKRLGAENVGRIENEGGIVLLTAKQLDRTVAGTVNNDGLIEAGSAELDGGKIVLRGIGEAVDVASKGKISASSEKAGGGAVKVVGEGKVEVSGIIEAKGGLKGGAVDISGKKETSLADALVSAEGPEGGLIRLGGSYQGGKNDSVMPGEYTEMFVNQFGFLDNLSNTLNLNIDQNSEISSGKNGTVISFSDGVANIDGIIKGRNVETSGKQLNISIPPIIYDNGIWLIDPDKISISSGCTGTDLSSSCINSNWLGVNGSGGNARYTIQANEILINSNINFTPTNLITIHGLDELRVADNIIISSSDNDDSNTSGLHLVSNSHVVIGNNVTIDGWHSFSVTAPRFDAGRNFNAEAKENIGFGANEINIGNNSLLASNMILLETSHYARDANFPLRSEKIFIGLNSIIKGNLLQVSARYLEAPGLVIEDYLRNLKNSSDLRFIDIELISGHVKTQNTIYFDKYCCARNGVVGLYYSPGIIRKFEGGSIDNPVIEANYIQLLGMNPDEYYLDIYSWKTDRLYVKPGIQILGAVTDNAPHVYNVSSYPDWPFYSTRIQFKDGTFNGGSSELQRREQMTLYMYYFLKDRNPTYSYSGNNYDTLLADFSAYIRMLVNIDIETLNDTGLNSLLSSNTILNTILTVLRNQYGQSYQLALSDSDIDLFEQVSYMVAYINAVGRHFTYNNNISDLQIAYRNAKNYLLDQKEISDILTKLLVLDPSFNGSLDEVRNYYSNLRYEMVNAIKVYNGHDHVNDTDANIKAAYDWASGLMLTFIRQWLPASQVPVGIAGLASAYVSALAAKASWEASQKEIPPTPPDPYIPIVDPSPDPDPDPDPDPNPENGYQTSPFDPEDPNMTEADFKAAFYDNLDKFGYFIDQQIADQLMGALNDILISTVYRNFLTKTGLSLTVKELTWKEFYFAISNGEIFTWNSYKGVLVQGMLEGILVNIAKSIIKHDLNIPDNPTTSQEIWIDFGIDAIFIVLSGSLQGGTFGIAKEGIFHLIERTGDIINGYNTLLNNISDAEFSVVRNILTKAQTFSVYTTLPEGSEGKRLLEDMINDKSSFESKMTQRIIGDLLLISEDEVPSMAEIINDFCNVYGYVLLDDDAKLKQGLDKLYQKAAELDGDNWITSPHTKLLDNLLSKFNLEYCKGNCLIRQMGQGSGS